MYQTADSESFMINHINSEYQDFIKHKIYNPGFNNKECGTGETRMVVKIDKKISLATLFSAPPLVSPPKNI